MYEDGYAKCLRGRVSPSSERFAAALALSVQTLAVCDFLLPSTWGFGVNNLFLLNTAYKKIVKVYALRKRK